MKTLCFFSCILGWLSFLNMVHGQSTTPHYSFRQYVVNIQLASHKDAERGILYDVTDSTIVLAPVRQLNPTLRRILVQRGGTLPSTDSLCQILPLRTYRYTDITRLSIRRRGAAIKGFVLGTVAAAVVWGPPMVTAWNEVTEVFTFGLVQNKRMPTGEAIALATSTGVLLGGLPGLGLGALSGKTIRVNQQAASTEVKYKLRERSLVEQINRAALYAR